MNVNAHEFPRRHRVTVDEYHRMGNAGIFSEDDRLELIEGEIIDMAPIETRHAESVSRLARLFIKGSTAVVRVRARSVSRANPNRSRISPSYRTGVTSTPTRVRKMFIC
ncbi:hypothetical conserved protein [Methylocaldum marinum]|uniref:Hypothetical conserved protein n=1 Tax=Methylocaldum marinum TaxID=1432792 RepID=A0A250KRG9_9GAMM|nr:Uma2 family endonuclease [Methylocaldum marinum]BBA34187.1 hypothetical conserved protein [Methylocaldum marinum]